MGKLFTFHLKGMHKPIEISDVNESRTIPELKKALADSMSKRETLIFCTDADCIILNPTEIACISIKNYSSKDRINIEDHVFQDEVLDEDPIPTVIPKIAPTKHKIDFDDLDEMVIGEEVEEIESDDNEIDEVMARPSNIEQTRNNFLTELDDFVADREAASAPAPTPYAAPPVEPKKKPGPKPAAKAKMAEDIKLAKNHQQVTTVPSTVIIELDGDDDGDDA